MNTALISGDKATALTYFSDAAKEKYDAAFDVLMPRMDEIIQSYSPLQQMKVEGRISEYAINRKIDGINRIFLIYFLQGDDGVWRLDTM